jgi:hypothetical protein
MTLRSSLALLALASLFTACTDGGDDTDTDTGTDTDPGTEVAKNTTLPDGTTGFSGTMTYDSVTTGFDEVEADIDRACAAEFAVSGDEFAGDCNDCDWAFTVTATETSNSCGNDLDAVRALQVPQVSVVGGSNVLAFWETLDGQQGTYTDVLAFVTPTEDGLGFGDAIGLYYYGEAYGAGTFDIVESAFSWTLDGTENLVARAPFGATDCLNEGIVAPASDLEAADTSANSLTGNQACPGEDDPVLWDEYTVDATAGDTITVSVDTVADATAFDSLLVILSPSGCELYRADDSFDCEFAPTDWQCSGAEFSAPEDGTYRFLVANIGSCQDEAAGGSYRINTSSDTLAAGLQSQETGDTTVELLSTIDIAVDATFE